ncbi:MAG: cytochrome c [Rhizobiaceae bacterium]
MIKFLFMCMFVLLMPNAVLAQTQAELSELLHGEGLANENCAKCHAIGLTGESPNSGAIPFRKLSSIRSITLIGWELMNEDWGKHRKMPQFEITADQVRDILKWIKWVQPVEQGRRLIEKNCSQCHAVGLDDESSHPQAIAFRDISIFYPVEALEEAFAEGIESGHPDMPVFETSIDQLRAMIAYMETLQQNSGAD